MATIQPSINAGFTAANNNLESVAISPTFKFLLAYNSSSALMKRFDGSAYGAVAATRVPAGPGDWTPDGLYYVGSAGSGSIQLREMEDAGPKTTVLHTLNLAAVRSIKHVKDDIFLGMPVSNTNDALFFKLDRTAKQLVSVGALNFSSIQGWDVSDNGVLLVLHGATAAKSISRVDVSSGAPVVADVLSNAANNCNFLSVSADGTRWAAGTTSGVSAIGLVSPFQVVPFAFDPQVQAFAFLFNDEYIQALHGTSSTTQRFYKINSDLSSVVLATSSVTFPGMSPGNPSSQLTRRPFARVTNAAGETLTAWKLSATTSQSPQFYFRMAIPDAPPASLVALAPMADAAFSTKPANVTAILGDVAPMPLAELLAQINTPSDLFAVAPMADSFFNAGIRGSASFVSLAPMAFAIATAPATPAYIVAKVSPPKAFFQAHPPVPIEFVARAKAPTAFFEGEKQAAAEFIATMPAPKAFFQQRNRRRLVLFAVNEL